MSSSLILQKMKRSKDTTSHPLHRISRNLSCFRRNSSTREKWCRREADAPYERHCIVDETSETLEMINAPPTEPILLEILEEEALLDGPNIIDLDRSNDDEDDDPLKYSLSDIHAILDPAPTTPKLHRSSEQLPEETFALEKTGSGDETGEEEPVDTDPELSSTNATFSRYDVARAVVKRPRRRYRSAGLRQTTPRGRSRLI